MVNTKPSKLTYWLVFGFILCGIPCLVAGPLYQGLFGFSVGTNEANVTAQCANRLRKVGQAMEMYTVSNNGLYPPADRWIEATWTYASKRHPEDETGSPYRCPSVWRKESQGYGYAFNNEVVGIRTSELPDPDGTPIVFDSTLLQKNAHSDLDTTPKPPRHRSGTVNHGISANGGIIELDRQKQNVSPEQSRPQIVK